MKNLGTNGEKRDLDLSYAVLGSDIPLQGSGVYSPTLL